jgi:Protein of unknown function (DUF3237)
MVQAPELEFVFAARVKVAPPIELGETPQGHRRMVPILGGSFAGPRIKGEIVPGGADWQILRADGATDLTARYVMRAEDGALIAVANRGLRRAPPEIMAKLLRGEPVDPAQVYFRATPRFETAAPAHRWLNEHLFLCLGQRQPDEVLLDFFRVL